MKHVYNPLIRITLSIAPITRFLNVSLFYLLPTENLHRPGLEPGIEITSVLLPCCCVLFSDSLCSFQIGVSRYVTIWEDIISKIKVVVIRTVRRKRGRVATFSKSTIVTGVNCVFRKGYTKAKNLFSETKILLRKSLFSSIEVQLLLVVSACAIGANEK